MISIKPFRGPLVALFCCEAYLKCKRGRLCSICKVVCEGQVNPRATIYSQDLLAIVARSYRALIDPSMGGVCCHATFDNSPLPSRFVILDIISNLKPLPLKQMLKDISIIFLSVGS